VKEINIEILHTIFKKHNKLMARYAWEPNEIVAYERLMRELSNVKTVHVEEVCSQT
jgi:hypothetical protein